MATPWIDVCASEEIAPGEAKMVRVDGSAVALWRTEDGSLHGVDNRCPHEGYPLVKGELTGCSLTCSWHNYKFDLRDGRCLVGEEDVRVFPLKEEDGRVFVDATPPDPERERRRLWRSLEDGAVEGDLGRAARDIARLLELEVEPTRILQEIAALDADRAKWGATHVLAVCADLRERMLRHPEEHPLTPLLHAVELFVEGSQRRPAAPRPAAARREGEEGEEELRHRFLEAVEAEDLEGAGGLLSLCLESFAFETVSEWLLLAASSHFLSFGHPLIYATKLEELMADAPGELQARVCHGLLRGIVYATREDVLPPMFVTHEWLSGNEASRRRWAETPGTRLLTPKQHADLVREILYGDAETTCRALDQLLEEGFAPQAICNALVRAAAERFWRFNASIHEDITIQDGWLHVSHPFTFAHATREAVQRLPDAHTLGSLYHAAHFIQRAKKLDGEVEESMEAGGEFDADALAVALRSGDVSATLQAAAPAIHDRSRRDELRGAVDALVLADVATRPIYIAHVLKTTRVAFEEAVALPPEAAPMTLQALLRFLATPKNERPLRRQAHEARNLIESGKLPRLLSA